MQTKDWTEADLLESARALKAAVRSYRDAVQAGGDRAAAGLHLDRCRSRFRACCDAVERGEVSL